MTEVKRVRETDLAVAVVENSPKKQKLEKGGNGNGNGKMDSKELASAMALASLASFSPVKPVQTKAMHTSDESSVTTAAWESVPAKPIPISPDARSPARAIKRVHFANSVKEKQSLGHHHMPFHPSRPPHAFSVRPPHPGFGVYPMRQQAPPWMQSRMLPPRLMRPPMAPPSESHWVCDYCNAASFTTYEEACIHEEACRHHMKMTGTPLVVTSYQKGQSTDSEIDNQEKGPNTRPTSGADWFSGSISLSIPESDSEWLSEINCFIRKHCIEAFSATDEDVSQTSKRGRITLHQVGIRCRHCKHLPMKDRAVAAVSYPTSVAGIYESVKRWQRVHLDHCEHVPHEVKAKMTELQNTNVWIPTTRQYWTDSARALGMVDTEGGIRFSCDPKFLRDSNKTESSESVAELSSGEKKDSKTLLSDGDYIVFPEDMRIVPPYVYFLMRQVESCHFSEVDRFVARSKGPVGYPGFQCRHCSGHAGLGKYFPVSAKTLSTNSTSQNIHAHLLKCRKCPEHTKEKLVALKLEKSRAPRLEPGWRKVFFDKVWARLHG